MSLQFNEEFDNIINYILASEHCAHFIDYLERTKRGDFDCLNEFNRKTADTLLHSGSIPRIREFIPQDCRYSGYRDYKKTDKKIIKDLWQYAMCRKYRHIVINSVTDLHGKYILETKNICDADEGLYAEYTVRDHFKTVYKLNLNTTEDKPMISEKSETPIKSSILKSIEERTFINGKDVKEYSLQDKLQFIVRTEEEIDSLKKIRSDSKVVKKKIEKLESLLVHLVRIIDSEDA